MFGLIFSAFAAIGKPHYTFAMNGVSLATRSDRNGIWLTCLLGCCSSSICGNALCTLPSRRRHKMWRRLGERRTCIELKCVHYRKFRNTNCQHYTQVPECAIAGSCISRPQLRDSCETAQKGCGQQTGVVAFTKYEHGMTPPILRSHRALHDWLLVPRSFHHLPSLQIPGQSSHARGLTA